jgi:hypothetical protein
VARPGGHRSTRVALLALAVAGLAGCGGSSPLLHPAHVLNPGKTSVAGGMSGQLSVARDRDDDGRSIVEDVAVAPGVAPFVGARIGIEGDNEAGIAYTGRAARIDFRHAFRIAPLHLSLGVGGNALLPKPNDDDSLSVYGGGADFPVLLGWTSDADLYSVWFGPRGGFDIFGGNAASSLIRAGGSETSTETLSGSHGYFGGVAGLRVGFRHVHAALELDVLYHLGSVSFDDDSFSGGALTISPSGALAVSF